MSATKALQGVTLRDSSATELGVAGAPVRVDPTGTTPQPVSATSLPLPSGAATEATLASRATEATLAALNVVLTAIRDTAGIKKVLDLVGVVGAAANGAAVSGNPVLVGGSDGSAARSVRTRTDGTLYVELTGSTVQAVQVDDHPSFTVTAPAIAIGNNKSMLALMNGASSTKVLRVREIFIVNAQTGAVTGVVATLALLRITGFTGGTALTAVANDTNDTLDVNVTAAYASTVSGEAASFLQRWYLSTDEWGAGALDTESLQATFQTYFPAFRRIDTEMRPLTLRPGQGFTIKCQTNSTAGAFDIVIAFTQEDA